MSDQDPNDDGLSKTKLLTVFGTIIFLAFGWFFNALVESTTKLDDAINEGSQRLSLIELRLDRLEEKGSDD